MCVVSTPVRVLDVVCLLESIHIGLIFGWRVSILEGQECNDRIPMSSLMHDGTCKNLTPVLFGTCAVRMANIATTHARFMLSLSEPFLIPSFRVGKRGMSERAVASVAGSTRILCHAHRASANTTFLLTAGTVPASRSRIRAAEQVSGAFFYAAIPMLAADAHAPHMLTVTTHGMRLGPISASLVWWCTAS